METELLHQTLSNLGPVGLIAALVFYYYRKDSQRWEKDRESLNAERKDERAVLVSIIQASTQAMEQQTAALNALRRALPHDPP